MLRFGGGSSSEQKKQEKKPGQMLLGIDFDLTCTNEHFHTWLKNQGANSLPTVGPTEEEIQQYLSENSIDLPELVEAPGEKPKRPWKILPHAEPSSDTYYTDLDSGDVDWEEENEKGYQEAHAKWTSNFAEHKEQYELEIKEAEETFESKFSKYEADKEQYDIGNAAYQAYLKSSRQIENDVKQAIVDNEIIAEHGELPDVVQRPQNPGRRASEAETLEYKAQLKSFDAYNAQRTEILIAVLDKKSTVYQAAQGEKGRIISKETARDELQGIYLEPYIEKFSQKHGMKNPELGRIMKESLANGHCVAIVSYTLYPGGIKPLLKKGYELTDEELEQITVVGGFSTKENTIELMNVFTPPFSPVGKTLHLNAVIEQNGLTMPNHQIILVDDSGGNIKVAINEGQQTLQIGGGRESEKSKRFTGLHEWIKHPATEKRQPTIAEDMNAIFRELQICHAQAAEMAASSKVSASSDSRSPKVPIVSFQEFQKSSLHHDRKKLADVINRCQQKFEFGMAVTPVKVAEYLNMVPESLHEDLARIATKMGDDLQPIVQKEVESILGKVDRSAKLK